MTEAKRRLVELSRLAWDRKLTESTGGNMSVYDEGCIAITPTTTLKHFITVDDLVIMDIAGNTLHGARNPSSEYRMHLMIYRKCEEARAVFHAHPRYATTFAVNGDRLPVNMLPEAALTLAPIAYLPYRMPGTEEFAEAFDEALGEGCRTFVLRNHGVTVAARDPEEAYAKLETLEFLAQVAYLSGSRPGRMEIPQEEIDRFLARFRSSDTVDGSDDCK